MGQSGASPEADRRAQELKSSGIVRAWFLSRCILLRSRRCWLLRVESYLLCSTWLKRVVTERESSMHCIYMFISEQCWLVLRGK